MEIASCVTDIAVNQDKVVILFKIGISPLSICIEDTITTRLVRDEFTMLTMNSKRVLSLCRLQPDKSIKINSRKKYYNE